QQHERDAAKQEAVAKREAIVVEAERLAAQPEASVRWKETGQAFEQLFTDWQAAQRGGPQVPKSQADALWKRFRAARQQFDTARRAHFAQLDATNKDVKQRKERIIAAAEALAPKGIDGISAYRSLLDEWKAAGRASRKLDDQLWARFKAAGDVLYAAKAAEVAQTNEEYSANLVAKEELLGEAEALLQVTDRVAARKRLTEFQIRWDEIGRVPREAVRAVEGRLRAIEDHVKQLEDEHWRKSNPETKARSEGLRGQLEASISELEAEIAAAESAGDAKAKTAAEEKLSTQRSWLAALGD
ncbi:ATPase, partial [Leucobacter sp. OLES1]